jgi:serine/threonine-protein kinase RsbW
MDVLGEQAGAAAEPPERPVDGRISMPAVATSVPVVRRSIVGAALALGADRATAQRVALAVSEAATNAVLHAFPDSPGSVSAAVTRAGDELEVVVADDGQGLVPRSDSPGLGMGLGIIAEVSDRLSIPAAGRGGTELHMWFGLGGR